MSRIKYTLEASNGEFKDMKDAREYFYEHLDVFLDEADRVIPDISVLCDKDKFTDRGYEGIPNLIKG